MKKFKSFVLTILLILLFIGLLNENYNKKQELISANLELASIKAQYQHEVSVNKQLTNQVNTLKHRISTMKEVKVKPVVKFEPEVSKVSTGAVITGLVLSSINSVKNALSLAW